MVDNGQRTVSYLKLIFKRVFYTMKFVVASKTVGCDTLDDPLYVSFCIYRHKTYLENGDMFFKISHIYILYI